MRQGFAVTALLLVVGLPTMYVSDGGWDGVSRDLGHVAAFRPFALAVPASSGGSAKSSVRPPAVVTQARDAVVDGTISAAIAVGRSAAEIAYGQTPNANPFLVAPDNPYYLVGAPAPVEHADITGGISRAGGVAQQAAAEIASIADPTDYGSALKRYALATDPGNADLRYQIAEEYLNAPTPDYTSGAHWLLSAAELGSGKAALDLSALYLDGNGVEQNFPQAYLWASVALRSLASPADTAVARDRLDRLTRAMTTDEQTAAGAMVGAWQPRKIAGPGDAAAADIPEPAGNDG